MNKIRSLFSKTFQRSRRESFNVVEGDDVTYMMQSMNRFYMIIRDFTITQQIDGQQDNVVETSVRVSDL